MTTILERVYAHVAAIGVKLNLKNSEEEPVSTTSVDVQNANKTSAPEDAGLKRVIDAKNFKRYINHLFDCPYWKVPAKTTHKEALKHCTCGVAEFDADRLLKEMMVVKIIDRAEIACSLCKAGKEKYHTTEGFYHKSDGELDDYCDASPLWAWLMDMGFLKVKV